MHPLFSFCKQKENSGAVHMHAGTLSHKSEGIPLEFIVLGNPAYQTVAGNLGRGSSRGKHNRSLTDAYFY
jgi:hypothetical protein